MTDALLLLLPILAAVVTGPLIFRAVSDAMNTPKKPVEQSNMFAPNWHVQKLEARFRHLDSATDRVSGKLGQEIAKVRSETRSYHGHLSEGIKQGRADIEFLQAQLKILNDRLVAAEDLARQTSSELIKLRAEEAST